MKDEPLLPPEHDGYPGRVIDLAGVRLRFGQRSPKAEKACQHKTLIYSEPERRIWCEDCERTIDSFDAVMMLVRNYDRMLSDVRSKKFMADAAMKATLVRRAAKEIDRTWSGNMAPLCPHCRSGLLPEDFDLGKRSSYGRDYELARRKRAADARRGEAVARPDGRGAEGVGDGEG